MTRAVPYASDAALDQGPSVTVGERTNVRGPRMTHTRNAQP